MTADAQAPWLLPCGCNTTDVRTPLDHRADCPTRRPDPEAFNLTKAAQYLTLAVMGATTGSTHPDAARAAVTVWEALTGLYGQAAIDYADRLVLEAPTGLPTIAILPPF